MPRWLFNMRPRTKKRMPLQIAIWLKYGEGRNIVPSQNRAMKMKIPYFQVAVAILALLGTSLAHGQEKQPLLDGMQAMESGFAAVESQFGRGDSSVSGPDFDQASNEWRMLIERGEATTYRRFFVTVNESSGLVCVRELPAGDCVARGDAAVPLQAARDKLRGLAEAALDPPPDLQGVMIAVIRHQLGPGSYLASNRMPLYVSLKSPKDDGMINLSAESIRSLDDTGLQLLPGSAWKAPQSGTRVGTTMNMGVGTPTRRPDGDYDITFGFWCGGLCASSHTAVLRHDASGWRVISSVMNSIS